MAGAIKKRFGAGHVKSQRGAEESPFVKWTLIAVAMLFCLVFLLLPLINVFAQAFSKGWQAYGQALTHPESWSAIKLTLLVAAIAVPLNVLFGLAAAWAIAKFEFRGKALLITLIDLPFSISPVVAGLMFILLFGAQGYLGPWLSEPHISVPWPGWDAGGFALHWKQLWHSTESVKIIFAVPGVVIVTVFVTFPFVARELIPVMQAAGTDQEQAALTLGANGWQTFWHVTLPGVKWGLIYGVILCNARAMGEFGAVRVVSANIAKHTQTMPLRVESLNDGFKSQAAFAVASLLAVLALVTLAVKTVLEWKQAREFEHAQLATTEPDDGLVSSQG
jgi:sulfate transport system permease protein